MMIFRILAIYLYAFGVGAVECDPVLGLPLSEQQLAPFEQVLTENDSDCFSESALSSGSNPEGQLKNLMRHLSDEEVFVRLIMAETLASTCPSRDIARGIAWVLKNRVDARNSSRYGQGRDVVFKDYQFRSSTGGCDVAKRKVFMCPSSANNTQLYQMARDAYLETQNANSNNPLSGSYQYFFFKHFDQSRNCARWRGVIPDWAKPAREVQARDLNIDRSCIKFYK